MRRWGANCDHLRTVTFIVAFHPSDVMRMKYTPLALRRFIRANIQSTALDARRSVQIEVRKSERVVVARVDGGRPRSVRKLNRALAARLAEGASPEIAIALIIPVGASSRLAALSVSTRTPISTDLGRPEN